MLKLFSFLSIVFGITLLSFGLYLLWQNYDSNRLSFTNYKYSASEAQQIEKDNLPVTIALPDVSIDVPVIPAKVENNKWDTTDAGASYLTSSPVPGKEGNSIVYAHNMASLFGRLPEVKPGNTVEVTYADNTKKTFSVAYTLEVSPGDASILQNNNDTRMTIYTCSGFMDTKRFVVVAFPTE